MLVNIKKNFWVEEKKLSNFYPVSIILEKIKQNFLFYVFVAEKAENIVEVILEAILLNMDLTNEIKTTQTNKQMSAEFPRLEQTI